MNLRVMTFNLRYDRPDPPPDDWRSRRGAVVECLTRWAPDLVATQEGLAWQVLDLLVDLPDYAPAGRDRRGTGRDEHTTVLWRRDKLTRTAWGDLALSDTPTLPGSIGAGWGNRLPRMATWARFGDLVFASFHLDHESALARERGAACLLVEIARLDARHVILAGDCNEPPGAPARRALAACHRDLTPRGATRTGFHGDDDAEIDAIYASAGITPVTAWIDAGRSDGPRASDHLPVIADLEV